jgi:methionine sulfoxide reductase heme-binding subunit
MPYPLDPSAATVRRAAAPTPREAAARVGPSTFRLGRRSTLVLLAVLGIVLIYATDQILPPATDRQAELRLWLAARATGIVAFLLLTAQVVFGLVLSHPHNKTTWRLSKLVFPWHDHLWVFVTAFAAGHIVSLVADPKAHVGILGAFIPGLSQYRSVPVALGTLSLYAFLITALTARQTRLLPAGRWLTLHRLAIGIFAVTWVHGMLAGTDSDLLRPVYILAAIVVIEAAAYRYWAARRARATFSVVRDDPRRFEEEQAA